MPAWRMFLSRSSVRMSPVSDSAFLVSAAFMSTCIRKCTPPRRSRPRYIGSACSAGQPVRRARQQVQRDDVARVGRVGVQRLADRVLGLDLRVGVGKARLAPSCLRTARSRPSGRPAAGPPRRAADQCRVDLDRGLAADETCTAGASPKKLGSGVEQRRPAARSPGSRTSTADSGSCGSLRGAFGAPQRIT